MPGISSLAFCGSNNGSSSSSRQGRVRFCGGTMELFTEIPSHLSPWMRTLPHNESTQEIELLMDSDTTASTTVDGEEGGLNESTLCHVQSRMKLECGSLSCSDHVKNILSREIGISSANSDSDFVDLGVCVGDLYIFDSEIFWWGCVGAERSGGSEENMSDAPSKFGFRIFYEDVLLYGIMKRRGVDTEQEDEEEEEEEEGSVSSPSTGSFIYMQLENTRGDWDGEEEEEEDADEILYEVNFVPVLSSSSPLHVDEEEEEKERLERICDCIKACVIAHPPPNQEEDDDDYEEEEEEKEEEEDAIAMITSDPYGEMVLNSLGDKEGETQTLGGDQGEEEEDGLFRCVDEAVLLKGQEGEEDVQFYTGEDLARLCLGKGGAGQEEEEGEGGIVLCEDGRRVLTHLETLVSEEMNG
eukprot:Nk52_evm1s1713 gene=Nk52_evmTU1s1713